MARRGARGDGGSGMGNLAWTVGDVSVTRVVEPEVALPLTGLLPEAMPAALARHRRWLEPHFLHGWNTRREGERFVARA